MLKLLRNKKTAKKIWIGLAIIIVPAFTLWGFGSAFRSRQEITQLGKIYGKAISPLEFRDAVTAVRVQVILQFGDRYEEALKSINFEEQARERLLLLYTAQKRRLAASDKEVMELIASYPFFQLNGAFDNKVYNQILQYVFHIQPRLFEEQMRQNLMITKLYQQVTKDIAVNDQEIREEYIKANEKIAVEYLESLPLEFAKSLKPQEAELKDYFGENRLKFKQPLSFNLEYLTLGSPDKINGLAQRLDKKGAFEKFAKDNSLAINETGVFAQDEPIPKLGWSTQGINLISRLKTGQCAVIEENKKYYILKLKEKIEPYIPEFEKIKDKVKEAFLKERSNTLARDKIEQAALRLETEKDFSLVAREFGLKAGLTETFGFGAYLEGIGASDDLWLAGHKLKTGEVSPVIPAPSGYYLIKLKSVSPVDEKKFADEKTDFSLKLLQQKKQDAFESFFEDLKKRNQ